MSSNLLQWTTSRTNHMTMTVDSGKTELTSTSSLRHIVALQTVVFFHVGGGQRPFVAEWSSQNLSLSDMTKNWRYRAVLQWRCEVQTLLARSCKQNKHASLASFYWTSEFFHRCASFPAAPSTGTRSSVCSSDRQKGWVDSSILCAWRRG